MPFHATKNVCIEFDLIIRSDTYNLSLLAVKLLQETLKENSDSNINRFIFYEYTMFINHVNLEIKPEDNNKKPLK